MATIRKRTGKKGPTWQIDYFDPGGKRVRQSFKKKKEAEQELGKGVSLIGENRYLDVKKDYTTTIAELIEKYVENYQHQASFKGWKDYSIAMFKDYFGEDSRLSSIRYVELETFRNKIRKTPTVRSTRRADATVNRVIACLHHIKKAVDWEMIDQSPFDRGDTLLLKENNKRLRFLSKDEIDRLLAECPTHLRRIFECAIHTGMRKGEILSLKWSQIRNGFIYLDKTKTNEARQIPINDGLAALFKEIRRELRGEYVFTYRHNEDKIKGTEPVRKRKKPAPVAEAISSTKSAFTSALRRAGIEDFRFLDLRHTFASHMIMKGAGLKDVQEILGHKSMSITMRYAHLSQEHKKKAVNLLNELTPPPKADCHKSVTFCDSPRSADG